MPSASERRILLGVSEIHDALRDVMLLLNVPEGEHRTMKMSGAAIGIGRGLARIRETLDYAKMQQEDQAV